MKKKSDTTLSLLREIRDLLKKEEIAKVEKTPKDTFPPKTAKEILEECNNSVDGGKLLYSGLTGWYSDQDFFTKETCRPISMNFMPLAHKGKSWNECRDLGEMFNFAEIVYLLRESREFRDMFRGYNWTWTSSRVSGGGLVDVGGFDGRGARVLSRSVDASHDALGLSFSHS